MSSLDYLDLCRLCLVKDRVSVPIFEGEGDVRQIFLKIASCLPVKVTREDKLPKKICDDCVYKVELFYQFWNTTANAEKQLLQWIGEVDMDEKSDYVTEVLNSEQTENRLEMMQSAEEQSNNIEINMMDGMGLGLPIIMSTNEQMSSNPITSSANVQSVQSVGSTTQAHSQLVQKDGTHEEEENTEDECDVDDGMHVKDENDSSVNDSRSMETSYVSVPLDCDEAGPSGLQQQKLSDMTDMEMAQQSAEGDIKVGLLKTQNVALSLSTIDDQKSPKVHYQCEICKKQFKLKNLFEGHLVAHSDVRPYQCDICNKSFKRTSTLAVHRRIHTLEKNFICDVCGRAFVQASQLAMHQRRHFEKYICKCEICGKGFFTNAELHGHMNIKHGAKEHVCHFCSKSFPNNHTLARHTKIHDPNFKPIKHQCEFCGKIFSYKNSLVVHVKSHTGENKYDCHLCGKSVSSKGSLQDHLRLHSGEKSWICDVCGKAFYKRTTLAVHKRTHTGEKPYNCDTCGKSFTQHSTLVIHKRYHTGQRPYQCTLCPKSFVSRALLNTHSKIHAPV